MTVEITCATEEVEIYYVVDNSNDITGGRLSDFEKHKVLYEKPLTLTIENPQGGTLYPCGGKDGTKELVSYGKKRSAICESSGKRSF